MSTDFPPSDAFEWSPEELAMVKISEEQVDLVCEQFGIPFNYFGASPARAAMDSLAKEESAMEMLGKMVSRMIGDRS